MGENSKIEWTHHTFNPWIGCTKVGPPCDHCYAEAMSNRYGWTTWGPHGERKRTSEANWKKPLQWAKRAVGRERVFCASLSDWLDNQVPQSWRDDLGDLIRATPQLDWLLLTKRIQNYKRLAPWQEAPANVWLGITCGDQVEYDRDWPKLAALPATVHFVSYEPALGPLSIGGFRETPEWIICGGESGPNARPMHPDWARSLRDQCQAAGVPFFFKQWGEWAPVPARHDLPARPQMVSVGDIYIERSGRQAVVRRDLSCELEARPVEVMRCVGKKVAGRLLDGREWSEWPER